MPDIWMDVDTAVVVPMNILPIIDDTDFKSIETGVVYNTSGLVVVWNFVTPAGAQSQVQIHPTTGGSHDVANLGNGIYSIEIPASGGDHASNDTEGVGWITGIATGMLAFRGPTIGFRRAALNDLLIEGGTASTNLEDFFDGTGYAGGTAKLTVEVSKWSGQNVATPNVNGVPLVDIKYFLGTAITEGAAGRIGAAVTKYFDVATPVMTVESVNQTGDSYAKVDTEIGTMQGNVTDILADTNEIQAELADGGRTDLLIDGIASKTVNLPASPAAVGSAMTLADDAITAGKFDESTAFPLKADDSGNTYVARTGADSDTLELLSDQIDAEAVKTTAIKAKTDPLPAVWCAP